MSSLNRTSCLAHALTVAAIVAAAVSPATASTKHKAAPHQLTAVDSELHSISAHAPVRFFSINQVLAKRAGRINPIDSVQLAAVTPNDQATDAPVVGMPQPKSADGPFGLFEFRAPEGQLWSKWRNAEADIKRDVAVMERCRAQPEHCSSRAAERFIELIDEARRHEGRERLATVNRAVNNAVRYMSDLEQHGVEDLWSAPLATFTTGFGDCEDYAIAKYVALKEAGVSTDDLRLLLVRDQVARQDHAVLAARENGRWLILDNRHMLMPEDTAMWNFVPLFAIDQQGVKLFASPYAKRPLEDGVAAVSSSAPDAVSPAETGTEVSEFGAHG